MITIDQITTGSLLGSGSFDKLVQVCKLHLQGEYESGRINGDKYADAFIAIMNNALAQAIQFTVSAYTAGKQGELTEEQKKLIIQQTKSEMAKILDTVDGAPVLGSIGKQKAVHDGQAKAFRHNSLQAATKLMTDVWSVQRSTDEAIAPNDQNMLVDRNIGSSVQTMLSELGISAFGTKGPIASLNIAGRYGAITGNAGVGNSIVSMKIIDEKGVSMAASGWVLDMNTGEFGKTDIDLALLSKGTLTAYIEVKTHTQVPYTATARAEYV